MRFIVPLIIMAVLFVAGPSTARTIADAGFAVVKADMNRNEGCTLGLDEEACVAVIDQNGTAPPGDDTVWWNKSVEEASVHVTDLPVGEPVHKSFRPDQLTLEHPAFSMVNESWKALDSMLSPGVRQYVRLESAELPDKEGDALNTATWGLRVDVYPPEGEPQRFWVICWDLACERMWWGKFESKEQGIYVASDALGSQDEWESDWWLSGFFGPDGYFGCLEIWREVGCPEGILVSTRENLAFIVPIAKEMTPDVHTFYAMDKASLHVKPSSPREKDNEPFTNRTPVAPGPQEAFQVPAPKRASPASAKPTQEPHPPRGPVLTPMPLANKATPAVRLQSGNGPFANLEFPVAIATAIAAGAAVLVWLAVLFTRLRRERVLEHPVRRAIYDAICKEPGIRVGTLASRFSVNYGTAQHHVDALAGFSLVKMQGRQLLPIGLLSTAEEQRFTGLLANPTARRVYDFLIARGPQDLTQIAAGLGIGYTTASATTVQLRSAGLVVRRREWRRWVLESMPGSTGPRPREPEFVWNLDALPTPAKPANSAQTTRTPQ